jgi:dihydrofolate reductase
MRRVIAGMTMSLDGFVADRDGGIGALYADFAELQRSDYMRAITEETGAVLMGRRTFEMAGDPDSYADDYEFQVPIFVVTHHPPERHPKENDRLTITFVTDGIEPAVARAVAAAGDRAVTVVGGIDTIGQLLRAGLVDEMSIDVVPVFLGAGRRLFDAPDLSRIALELIGEQAVGQRVALSYRVRRPE